MSEYCWTLYDQEIDRVKAALRRHAEVLREMRALARGECCPACFHGMAYVEAEEQAARTAAWLRVLLYKRGHEEDLALADALLAEHGDPTPKKVRACRPRV